MDELSVLDGSKCILQLRGVRPFLSQKYDITQHPNYKTANIYAQLDFQSKGSSAEAMLAGLGLKATEIVPAAE